MGTRSAYTHGTFSWVDNATTDQEGTKRFYSALFGWEFDDRPAGEGVIYSMALKGGEPVTAVGPQQQDEIDQGIPPHWNNYVAVDDVDATAAQVGPLGGQLVVPPFEVLDAGRMAVVIDPTGGVLCLWQARSMPGAGVVNEPGALCWNELNTRDVETAKRFYGELFGWTFEQIPDIEMEYWAISNDGRANGGLRPIGPEMPEHVPSHWLVYFGVDSIDSALGAAEAAGGSVIMGKMPVGPPNSIAVLRDPAGAPFAIFEGRFDD